MIKVLVVEDNKYKIENYKQILRPLENEFEILTYSDSTIHAKKELARQKFDVMILDIALPLRSGEPPIMDAGLALFIELQYSSNMNMPDHIIAITEYQNVFDKNICEFNNNLISFLKYEASSDEWRSRITNLLNQVIRAHNDGDRIISDYNYDMAIICALDDPELKHILNLNYSWMPYSKIEDCASYYVGNITCKTKKMKIVCAAAGEMGMTASAVLTTKIIQQFRPKYLGMTGIAAGVRGGNRNYGDILIADPSFDYGSGKIAINEEESDFRPDYKQQRIDPDLIRIFRAMSLDTAFLTSIKDKYSDFISETELKIHIGAFGSGSSVVADNEIVKKVVEHSRNLIGIDMEAYGVMFASNQYIKPKPTAFSIKSICDFADAKKDDKYQDYAAYTSASVMNNFIERLLS